MGVAGWTRWRIGWGDARSEGAARLRAFVRARAFRRFWTPPLPQQIHDNGFALQVQDPVDHEWGLEPGEGFSDGSVKWPRWFCLASGGMSLVQLDQQGDPVRWHAATLTKGCRHVAVNCEMYGMAAAAVYAPENAEFT